MSGPWIAAVVTLWAVMLVTVLVLIGLVRRVVPLLDVLERRLDILQFADTLQGLAPGDTVPEFEALDQKGETVRLADLLGRPAVFVLLEPGCEPCDRLIDEFKQGDVDVGDVALHLVSEERDHAPEVISLVQLARSVTFAFRSTVSPQAFAVNERGIVVGRAIPQFVEDVKRLARQLSEDQRSRGASSTQEEEVVR